MRKWRLLSSTKGEENRIELCTANRNHGNRGYNILTGMEPFDLSPYFLIIWTQKWTQNQRALSKSIVKKSDHIFSGID